MANTYQGLTNTEVKTLQTKHGLNLLPQHKSKSSFKIIVDIIKEPMISLLIVGGGLYLWLGDPGEAIMLFIMIGVVSFITFLQEKRTENALQSLKAIASPKCRVIRDGTESTVDSSQLVPGDIIRVLEGERIPADALVLESDNLQVDESSLTGESMPVSKSATKTKDHSQLTQSNRVFSASLVKSGWVIAEVKVTGNQTEIGKIGVSLESITEQPTRIQTETNHIVKISAIGGLLVSLFVVIGMGLETGKWIEGLLQGIAIAMSMMPEEFPVVLTIFMALGAAKIAKKHVLMRQLPALETLGSATVLCVDKTGTLTKNSMEIAAVADRNALSESLNMLTYNQQEVVRIAANACQEHQDDSMERAINDVFKTIPHEINSVTLKKHYPISPQHLYMANVWEQPNGEQTIAAKGAPEAVMKLCSSLSKEEIADLETLINERAGKGMRLLAVAETGSIKGWDNETKCETIPFHYVGLLAFADPIRPDAKAAIAECAAAGIRTVMITGDYQQTAKTIGDQLGLPGTDIIVTGDILKKTAPSKLKHLLAAASVCSRIMPEQKLAIVKALQANGEIVAMTGDGINDAPALKAANMGISMGVRGTDVAREASDMVLMDDSFSSIVSAIFEGRLIFDNIRKAIGFVMAIHIPIALMAIAPILFGLPPLLTPIHVVILEFIIDPACTLVFEAEKADRDIMTRKPRDPKGKIFNKQMYLTSLLYGLVVSVAVLVAYCLGRTMTLDPEVLRTIAFSTLICVNCVLIASYRSSRSIVSIIKTKNIAFWGIVGGVGVFLIATINIPVFRNIMRLTVLNIPETIIVGGAVIGSLACIELIKRIMKRYEF